jgi:hypothetical protein
VVDVGGEAGGGGDAHDSDTPNTGNFTGNEIRDNGVPGGTSTTNDKCNPPNTVTVIVHRCAAAEGIHTSAKTPPTTAAVAAKTPRRRRRGRDSVLW